MEEFLYMDPDTGMIITMIADGDGFRPANVYEEHMSRADSCEPIPPRVKSLFNEEAAIDELIRGYEHAYGNPPPAIAMV